MSRSNNFKRLKESEGKQRHKAYKSNKSWVYAAITSFAGVLGGGATSISTVHAETTADASKATEADASKTLASSNSTTIPAVQQLTSSADVTPRAGTGATIITKFVNQETGESIGSGEVTTHFNAGENMVFEVAPHFAGLVLDVNTSAIGGADDALLSFADWADFLGLDSPNDVIDYFNNVNPQEATDDEIIHLTYYYRTDYSVFTGQSETTIDAGPNAKDQLNIDDLVTTLTNSDGTPGDVSNVIASNIDDIDFTKAGTHTLILTYWDPTSMMTLTLNVQLNITDTTSESMSTSDSESVS
ncbi:hypothetical protein ESZ50_01595, partial [Weissella muntiaci]